MEIIPNKYKIRCELGACGNKAGYTLRFSRAGIRSRLHVCEACLGELHRASGDALKKDKAKGSERSARNG